MIIQVLYTKWYFRPNINQLLWASEPDWWFSLQRAARYDFMRENQFMDSWLSSAVLFSERFWGENWDIREEHHEHGYMKYMNLCSFFAILDLKSINSPALLWEPYLKGNPWLECFILSIYLIELFKEPQVCSLKGKSSSHFRVKWN